MRAGSATFWAAMLLLVASPPLAGQQSPSLPPASAVSQSVLQPALFADSLANLRDTAVLRMMERASVPGADEAPPELHLRYAMIEKRIFELTDDDDARKRAQHSFDKAKDQDEKNTWAHFGYGWALTHGPEFKTSFLR